MGILQTLFKAFLGLYLASSYKTLPGVYFIRFYFYAVRRLLLPIFTTKNTENMKHLENHEYGAFAHATLYTYASPLECDVYLHKNNATYFSELDINRCELMCSIFQKLFLESKRWPYVPVANVFTNFLKDIKPFDKYSVTSNILCWDQKWIYVISKFKKDNDKTLCSLSITKYVLKDGRKTIPPKEALEFCGLYNDKVAKISEDNMKLLATQCGFHETSPLENLEHKFVEIKA
ncbi:hypothetical protein TPHA_0A03710 [Tetrapisispora phaffii CBS 4417]|uniref:Thioesterase domain-containing protein n=1 Tax=Tetrapisispora phaffii (strain ATCC 24235 / CBS 4417 / NBRC 1672 / NRRL Y-8282 / UCD 70-5) TaxID=1071381 RepID=G8BNG9_TETPH|nr:hypothetical protein TPHA_0A03710 [Tetrapisispora phaffii CBS 4417]CCE61447.1 hypothetical protein TPHA_0A03710 [Tetrapisispora phaffii CBS 4417]